MTKKNFVIEVEGKTAEKAFSALVEKIAEFDKLGYVEVESSHDALCKKLKSYVKDREREIKKNLGGPTWVEFAQDHLELLNKILERIENQSTIYPKTIADILTTIEDQRLCPKYGPVGCIDATPRIKGKRAKKTFLFFGWRESK